MKAMFVHEHKFVRDENGCYFSSGQFPYRLWRRYLEVFDELVVVGRLRTLRAGETVRMLDQSSGPGVSFLEVPSLGGIQAMMFGRREAAGKIRSAMADCDAVIIRTSAVGQLAAGIAESLQKPWAVEVVGCAFDSLWNYGSWLGKIYAPVAAYMNRRMIGRAPFAIYVTQRFLQRRYPCPGVSVGCSDVQLVKRDEAVLAKRLARIGQSSFPLRIGLIGSLVHSHKGVDVALRALAIAKQRFPVFEFKVLGTGDPVRWQRLAADCGVAPQTEFCGTLANGEAVNRWLDEVDLYIQPSRVEGLPRALVEAMSRACPALGSNAGGIPELLDPSCIHKVDDSQGLAGLLTTALTDREWRSRQAVRNYQAAAAYDSEVLEEVRRKFWRKFVAYCQLRNETAGNRYDGVASIEH
jgi:glycosyltransferase involved in cell wall biosynthesis